MGGALDFLGASRWRLVGSPYIILAAYAVRSLFRLSARAGIASRSKSTPAIEEASTESGRRRAILTFRQVTMPLILPAFMAGLIFSFAPT